MGAAAGATHKTDCRTALGQGQSSGWSQLRQAEGVERVSAAGAAPGKAVVAGTQEMSPGNGRGPAWLGCRGSVSRAEALEQGAGVVNNNKPMRGLFHRRHHDNRGTARHSPPDVPFRVRPRGTKGWATVAMTGAAFGDRTPGEVNVFKCSFTVVTLCLKAKRERPQDVG